MTIRLCINPHLIPFLHKTKPIISNHIQIKYSLTQSLTLLHIPLHTTSKLFIPLQHILTLYFQHMWNCLNSKEAPLISTIEFKLNTSQPSIQSLLSMSPHVLDPSHWSQTKIISTIDLSFPPKQSIFLWNITSWSKHKASFDPSHLFQINTSQPSIFNTCQIIWKPREAPFDPSHPIQTISSQPSISFFPSKHWNIPWHILSLFSMPCEE